MDTLRFLLLLQFAALLYLIYRVRRLEQLLDGQVRTSRPNSRSGRAGKVVPLIRNRIPPGPYGQKPGPAGRDDKPSP